MPSNGPPLEIAIAGAGFAGLASAALLAQDGHRVTVYEKFDEPQSVGAGILVQPSGLAAMRTLGIADEVMAQGARVDALLGVNQRGRAVVDLKYDRWKAGSFGVGLHRGVLFDALWRLAAASGVRVVCNHEVREVAGLRADMVVVADGSRSSLRAKVGVPYTDRVYPWGAVWAVLPDADQRYGATLWQWYRGAHEMLGIMPTGRAPQDATPVVSLFWSLRADTYATWRQAGLDAFKARVLALNPACGDLLDRLTSIDQLTWACYHDVVMPFFHAGRCVVIGDAAHATSPQLGQGTNLALLDAIALRDALREKGEVPSALARYTEMRLGHSRFYGQASRWLTPLFQSDLRVLPWLRDWFMAPSSRWPVAGKLTRETLVGVRGGWVRGENLHA